MNIPQNTSYGNSAPQPIASSALLSKIKQMQTQKPTGDAYLASIGLSNNGNIPHQSFDVSAPQPLPMQFLAPTGNGPMPVDSSNIDQTSLGATMPVDPNNPKYRMLPDYLQQNNTLRAGNQGQPQTGQYASTGNLDTTRLRMLGSSEPGIEPGVENVDLSQPGALIRSKRGGTPENVAAQDPTGKTSWANPTTAAQNNEMMSGRSSGMFQIDHNIPLWLNGADVPANKHVLDNYTNQIKTNVQGVLLTLLSHNLITKPEAQLYAMRWSKLDPDGVQNVDGFGMVSPQNAVDMWQKWQDQNAKVDYGDWGGLKNALKPENTETVGETLPQIPIVTPLVREGAKGIASGASAGIVPYAASSYSDKADQLTGALAGVGGNLVGMMEGMEGIGALGTLAKGGLAKTGLGMFQNADKVTTLSNLLTKAVDPVALAMEKDAGKALARSTRGIYNSLQMGGVLKSLGVNAATLATYGQLPYLASGLTGQKVGESEPGDWMAPQMRQLVSDIAFAGVLGSAGKVGEMTSKVASKIPGVDASKEALSQVGSGASKVLEAIPGGSKVMKYLPDSISIVAAGTAFSLMNNKDDLTGAMANGLMLGVMHRMGMETKKIESSQPVIDALDKLNERTHQQIIDTYSTKQLKDLEAQGYTLSDIENTTKQLTTSFREAYKRSLPSELRQAEDMKDAQSMVQMFKDKPNGVHAGFSEPFINYAQNQPKDLTIIAPSDPLNPKFPVDKDGHGVIPITGVAEQTNAPVNANIKAFREAQADGTAGNYVYIVPRPDHIYTQSKINDETEDPLYKYANPQNIGQVVGIIEKPGQPRVYVDLGKLPDQNRIEGRPDSINTNQRVKEAVAEGRMKRFDPAFNKDTILDHMKTLGLDAMPVKANFLDTKSGQPFGTLSFDDSNWEKALEMQKSAPVGSIESNLQKVQYASTPEQKQVAAASVADQTGANAADMIKPVDETNPQPGTQQGVHSSPEQVVTYGVFEDLAKSARAVRTGVSDVETFMHQFNNEFGNVLDLQSAKELISSGKKFTVGKLMEVLGKAEASGKLSPSGKFNLNTTRQFLDAPEYQNSRAALVFKEMPIASEVAPTKQRTPVTSDTRDFKNPAIDNGGMKPNPEGTRGEENAIAQDIEKNWENQKSKATDLVGQTTPQEKAQIKRLTKGGLLEENPAGMHAARLGELRDSLRFAVKQSKDPYEQTWAKTLGTLMDKYFTKRAPDTEKVITPWYKRDDLGKVLRDTEYGKGAINKLFTEENREGREITQPASILRDYNRIRLATLSPRTAAERSQLEKLKSHTFNKRMAEFVNPAKETDLANDTVAKENIGPEEAGTFGMNIKNEAQGEDNNLKNLTKFEYAQPGLLQHIEGIGYGPRLGKNKNRMFTGKEPAHLAVKDAIEMFGNIVKGYNKSVGADKMKVSFNGPEEELSARSVIDPTWKKRYAPIIENIKKEIGEPKK